MRSNIHPPEVQSKCSLGRNQSGLWSRSVTVGLASQRVIVSTCLSVISAAVTRPALRARELACIWCPWSSVCTGERFLLKVWKVWDQDLQLDCQLGLPMSPRQSSAFDRLFANRRYLVVRDSQLGCERFNWSIARKSDRRSALSGC